MLDSQARGARCPGRRRRSGERGAVALQEEPILVDQDVLPTAPPARAPGQERRLAWLILATGLALPTLCWLLAKVQLIVQDRDTGPASSFFLTSSHLSVTAFVAAPFLVLAGVARWTLAGRFPGLRDLEPWERKTVVLTAFALLSIACLISFLYVFQSDSDQRVFLLAPIFALALLGLLVFGLVLGVFVTSTISAVARRGAGG